MRKKVPEEYRRNLPHIQPQGGMFFVTFRLQGSIPLSKLSEWNNLYKMTKTTSDEGVVDKTLKLEQQENYFLNMDEYLDKTSNGPYFLNNLSIANIVAEAIHYRDAKDYTLVCFCIMSNHVHLIMYNLKKPLSVILQELKSFSGKEAMAILKRMSAEELSKYKAHGALNKRFWQAKSFDRLVRNRNDMAAKINYTLNNPVKAGLVSHWKQWKWSYCIPQYVDF